MGKGDKKTKKGKIFAGSYGRVRPRKKSKDETIIPKPKVNKEVKKETKVKKAVSTKKKTTKKKKPAKKK